MKAVHSSPPCANRTRIGVTCARVTVIALWGALDACTLTPHYERPPLPVPAQYPQAQRGAMQSAAAPQTTTSGLSIVPAPAAAPAPSLATAPTAADIGWQEFYADARLRTLIALALTDNRDLRVAVLDIERSRQQYRIVRSSLLPDIEATASSDNARTPASVSAPGLPAVTRDDSVGIGVSAYELDLFGRLRSVDAEAEEALLATEEARRNVQISLVAEVAGDYLNLAADRQRLALAEQTLHSQSESYELTRREAEIGSASDLSLREAATTVESARVDVARYAGQVAQDVNALNLVVGTPVPAALEPHGLDDARVALDPGSELPGGLPAELLERRPDVLEAERTLRAANADIGAARAAFFPRITLTAQMGTTSNALSGLFAAGSRAWVFAPQVTLPLFTGGRNRATLASARATRDIDVAKYERTVQTAFREVADGLALRESLRNQLSAQRALVAASSDAYRLSDARYREGVDSYLNALDAQRTLYAAQQSLIGTELARMANLVTLYQALGGGWFEQTAGARVANRAE